MNLDEAKKLLRIYRPGTGDSEDPQIAEALAVAQHDPEAGRWLEKQVAQQEAVRQKFRQVKAPDGLLEQIISEHNAREKIIFWRQRTFLLAAAAMVAILIGLPFWLRPRLQESPGYAVYSAQMAATALRGYGMDVLTNDLEKIHSYLAQNHAPADYVLPAALQKAEVAGCAVQNWQGANISMICFRTGRPLRPGEQTDLWLFVINQASVKNAPAGVDPYFSKISSMATATWSQGGKLYLLGSTADTTVLRKFL